MHYFYMVLFFILSGFSPASASATDVLIADAALSSDGNKIAFSSGGNIFSVSATGGIAVALTFGEAFDQGVVWSPNGNQLAFSRTHSSTNDLYLLNLDDRHLRRLTYDSGPKEPMSFTPDGEQFLYGNLQLGDAQRSIRTPFHNQPQDWLLDVKTGRKNLFLPNGGEQADFNRDKTQLLYVAVNTVDPETRRHRSRSDASEIWLYDITRKKHRRPFTKDGIHRTSPRFAANGQSFFYLAETENTTNIWRWDGDGKNTQITFFTDNNINRISVSRSDAIVFIKDYKIYHLSADEATAKLIDIRIQSAIDDSPINKIAPQPKQLIPAPNGMLFAGIVNADLYLFNKFGKYKRLTSSPGVESDPSFSPDGKHLIYAASRDNIWGLYRIDIDLDNVDDSLSLPKTSAEIVVLADDLNRRYPAYSPNGKYIGHYVEGREVAVVEVETGTVTSLLQPNDYSFLYEEGESWLRFSPDSRYLAIPYGYSGEDAVKRIGLVPVDASLPIRSVSSQLARLEQVMWSRDGTQLVVMKGAVRLGAANNYEIGLISIFMSDAARNDALQAGEAWGQTSCSRDKGLTDSCKVTVVSEPVDKKMGSTQHEAASAPLKPYSFSEQDRTKLETSLLSTSDGSVYFTSLPDNIRFLVVSGYDTYYYIDTINRLTGERVRLKNLELNSTVKSIHYLEDIDQLYFVTDGAVQHISLKDYELNSDTEFVSIPAVSFSYIPSERRLAAFEEAWSRVKKLFYRSDMHGVDWQAIGERYRTLVAFASHDQELASLINNMLGELSASHLFVNYRSDPTINDDVNYILRPVHLGFFRTPNDTGPGEEIDRVLAGGPLDRLYYNISKGDRIIAINDTAVPDEGGVNRLLLGAADKVASVKLKRGDKTAKPSDYTILVRPVDTETIMQLNQARWMGSLAETVREITNGCAVYHYIPAMNEKTYMDLSNHLLAQRKASYAALIDIRSNAGGNETTQIIRFLNGQAESLIGRAGFPHTIIPYDQWLKPSSLLTDSFAYSDGSVFTQRFKDVFAEQKDKHVIYGEPVQGTGTAVIYRDLDVLPNLTIGIPVLPLRRLDGSYYENQMIVPDTEILFDPNQADLGIDNMLQSAAEHLYRQLKLSKACPL